MNIHERIEFWMKNEGVELYKSINLPEDPKVIDFACGFGEYTIPIALAIGNSGRVYAVDKDSNALKILKQRIASYAIVNVEVIKNNGEQKIDFDDDFADLIVMNDFIHGNDLKTKMPIRFAFFEEARRVLKNGGILSIAPFDCEYLRDKSGKKRKYTIDMIKLELAEFGFEFISKLDGSIHFEKYHSPYQWKIHNNDLKFEDLETGIILNFRNTK